MVSNCQMSNFNILNCPHVDNKTKVYYGIPKGPDPATIAAPIEDEEGEGGDQDNPDKPKKKKAKKDPMFSKKTKSDPNAPPPDRIPAPEW